MGTLDEDMSATESSIANEDEDLTEAVREFGKTHEIKKAVWSEAKDVAKRVAREILSDEKISVKFPMVPTETEEQQLAFQLVYEFLYTTGFKFAPTALKVEGGHQEIVKSRRALAKKLGLDASGQVPLLVQLCERAG